MGSGLPKLALIAGPTASGKSAAALALAERVGGTIVNADSAQVYRDLRVLTARPSPEDETRAPHRLFGHVDGGDAGYSAARWAAEAGAVIAEVHAAGGLPILVGGTGLYLRILLDGIAPVPAIDSTVRAAVRAMPVAEAHAALAALDPAGAARLHPADTTRVARALEVVRSTGRPLAEWQRARTGGIADEVALAAAVLLPERALLRERITRRAQAMLADGAIEEVAALLARPDLPPDAPIRRAIGVAPLAELLAGRADLDTAADNLIRATSQYAKRQYTWFRHQASSDWLTKTQSDDLVFLLETKLLD